MSWPRSSATERGLEVRSSGNQISRSKESCALQRGWSKLCPCKTWKIKWRGSSRKLIRPFCTPIPRSTLSMIRNWRKARLSLLARPWAPRLSSLMSLNNLRDKKVFTWGCLMGQLTTWNQLEVRVTKEEFLRPNMSPIFLCYRRELRIPNFHHRWLT